MFTIYQLFKKPYFIDKLYLLCYNIYEKFQKKGVHNTNDTDTHTYFDNFFYWHCHSF